MNVPRNIHALALNYPGVGEDSNQTPLYFVKSANAYCASGSRIPFPLDTEFFWAEVELGIVVRKTCDRVELSEARSCIQGFVVCSDLSCQNIYSRDHHLGFSKSRACFCPTSNEIAFLNPSQWKTLRMTTEINGRVTQEGSTENMLMDPAEAVSYLSRITQLEAGDLILTGTPPGWKNNGLKVGDRVRHTIDFVGDLEYEIV